MGYLKGKNTLMIFERQANLKYKTALFQADILLGNNKNRIYERVYSLRKKFDTKEDGDYPKEKQPPDSRILGYIQV